MRVVGAYCVSLLLPGLGLGWCPEGDGPCWLNIRSKSDAAQHPRGVLFKDGKSSSLGGVAAQSNYVAVLVGGDDAEHEQLRVGSDGKLKLGQGRAAEYTLDVETGSEQAIASLTGQRRKTGKAQEDGICAAVRLSDIENGESVALAHDLRGLGVIFGRKGDGLEASKAAVHIHRETPPGSLAMTAEGALTLSQSGPGASKYPRALFARGRGMSVSAPQIVFKDDILGSLEFTGYDGSKMLSAAKVTVAADGPVAPGKVAARLMFEVAGAKPSSTESGNIRATMTASTFHLQSGTSLIVSDGGDVTLESGDLVVGTGSAVIGGLLEVRGGTTVQGPLVAGQGSFKLEDGSANFNGENGVQIERGDLTIAEGKLRALGDVEVGGALRVLTNTGTAFSVVGETNFQGNIVASGTSMEILGDLRVQGPAQVGDLQASGQATFSGAVKLEEGASLSIGHAGTDNEELLFEVNPSLKKAMIDGEMIVAEGLTCEKLRVVSGGMSVEGEGSLTVTGNMDVGGPVSLASNVVVVAETESTGPSTGALVVKGGLGVEGAISLGDRVYFGKSQVASIGVEEDDTFVFGGNTVVHGTLTVRSVEEDGDDSIRVGNDGTVHALKDVHMTESLAVNGLAKFNSVLVDSNATFSATTEFLGNSSVRGSFSANTLTLTGGASIQGDTSIVSGNLDVKQGILTIGSGEEDEPQLRFAAEEANFYSTLIATKEAVQVNAPAVFLEPLQMQAGNLSFGSFTSVEGSDPAAVAELLATPAQTVLDVKTGEASFLSRGGNLSLTALTDLSLASETRSISLSAPTGNISLESSQAYLRLSEDGQVELGMSEQATVKVQDRVVQVTGEIRASTLTTKSLCKSNDEDEDEADAESVSSCVSFQQDGTLSLANGMMNISIETGRTVMGGSLDLRGPVISSAGYISPPVYIKAESIVELDTAAAYFVLIDDSAAPPSGPVLMALPHEAQAGQTTMVQNQASTGAEIVQRVVQGDDVQVETVAKLEQNTIVKVVFDGEKWKLPSTPHLSSVALHGVSSFEASRDLDIGNFSFAASNVKLHNLAIEEMNDAQQQECTDCNEADTSKTQRIALVGTDGTLSANNWTHVSENGTLHVREMAGTTFTGPVQMTGNELRNVSLVGGSIRGVTEFHVAAGMLVSGAVSESSDERLKTNISSIESIEALEIVKKMRGVRYHDKTSGEKHIGVIAQEVQELVPEVVSTDDTSGLLAVRYARLVPLLLESVKALEAKVQGLEHKLAALSNVKSDGSSPTTGQVKL